MSLIDQYLHNNDLLGYVQAVFTSVLGEFFYGFVILILCVPLYNRTQSMVYVAMFMILLSAAFYVITPIGLRGLIHIILVLTIGGVLFYLFTRGG